jgi:hypothetical protein
MHFIRRTLLLAALLLPALVQAGAWGAGSFENDDALDWVNDCVRSTGPKVVASTLYVALDPKYLEAPEASSAIAAAEVVAAARGKPGARLPTEVQAWLRQQSQTEMAKLAPTAAKAVERILSGPESELQALWKESKDYSSWQRSMQDLLVRLR